MMHFWLHAPTGLWIHLVQGSVKSCLLSFNKTKVFPKANNTTSEVQDFAFYDGEIETELTHPVFAQIGKA